MSAHYREAQEQIRAILASRTQAEPLLEGAEVWELLTCYPVPSVRTVQRYIDAIRHGEGFDVERHGFDVCRQTMRPTV